MNRTRSDLALLAFVLLAALVPGSAHAQSDDQLRKMLIEQSVRQTGLTCACPWQTMRNGSSCGKRSAYFKPNGYAPLCYPQDVTPEMLQRARQALQGPHGI